MRGTTSFGAPRLGAPGRPNLAMRAQMAAQASAAFAPAREHNRQYKSFASDTQGAIGPPAFASWLKHLYYTVSLARRADGDTTASTQFALDLLLADLLAALVRDDAEMIDRLTVRDRV